MKVVINKCYGGFGLSDEALQRYHELSNTKRKKSIYDIERNDPILVKIVEEMGDRADSRFSKLKVVEIPDDIVYYVRDCDGMEWVAECHRTWD